MENKKKAAVSVLAATAMVVAGGSAVMNVAGQVVPADATVSAEAASEAQIEGSVVSADASEGEFAWDQNTITSNEEVRNTFVPATAALCEATEDFEQVNPLEWKLTVSGDVTDSFTATVDELVNEQSVQQIMTCTCGGNPADGKATITAEVKGIPLNYLVGRAGAVEGVNTITFVSSDGTEVAMPLSYAIGRHGVITYQINGEDLSASVGGNNQLWLAGTSANYFVRDIAEVRITKEEQVPAKPGENMEYPNSPNVGLTSVVSG